MKKNIKIYLANGLFCQADRLYNEIIYKKLSDLGVAVYAPQFNLAINDKTKSASSLPIYEGDTDKLKWCNILLAVLDGQDLGVATEVGWIAGWNEKASKDEQKLIIGIYTDNREASKTHSPAKNKDMVEKGIAESQYPYINLYTIGACKKYGVIFDNIDSAIEFIKTIK